MSDWELTKQHQQGILDKLSEGVHYEIIPQSDDTRGCDVRLLEE